MLPFSVEQFLDIFAQYNDAVYPAQLVLLFAGMAAIFLALNRYRYSSNVISAILALLWLWAGIAYHILFFTKINGTALVFGVFFILQAAIFVYAGIWTDHLRFRYIAGGFGVAGLLILAYSIFVYPMLGYLFGHVYPRMPTFGVPCPTTLFTFGILFWTERRVSFYVLIIPFLWSAIALSAAANLGIVQDFALPAVAAISIGCLMRERHSC